MPRFAFGGQDLIIADGTALFWPARNALVVADLHLEKGSWFAERGQMLPPYDSIATLDRLARVVAATSATTLWALGDNFHDEAGPDRMAGPARERLAAMTNTLDWHWITGNHDAVLPVNMGGTVQDDAELDGIGLVHRSFAADLLGGTRPELSGHWHPKLRLSVRGRQISRPCFVMSETRLILPAFGAYTGGMAAGDPAILAVTGPRAEALIAGKDGVMRFGL